MTQDELRSLLDYDPLTGVFLWKVARGGSVRAGEVAGTFCTKGYRKIIVGGISYKAHRLAWFYVHGEWPAEQIDHINRVKDDNRIANLRVVSNGENRANTEPNRNNAIGAKNVHPVRNHYRVMVRRDKRNHHVGYFKSVNDAVTAREAWLSQYEGDRP